MQCSICSQLNNKLRVVVTDIRLHHTFTGVLKISLAGANNFVPTTSLTPCIIIIHVYTYLSTHRPENEGDLKNIPINRVIYIAWLYSY